MLEVIQWITMLSREVNAFQSESYTDLETRIASPKINPKATWLRSFKTSLFLHHLRYLSKVNCEHEIVQQCFDCSAADQRWAWGFSHSSSAHSPSPYESWLQSEFTLSPSPHRMIIHFNFTRLFFELRWFGNCKALHSISIKASIHAFCAFVPTTGH